VVSRWQAIYDLYLRRSHIGRRAGDVRRSPVRGLHVLRRLQSAEYDHCLRGAAGGPAGAARASQHSREGPEPACPTTDVIARRRVGGYGAESEPQGIVLMGRRDPRFDAAAVAQGRPMERPAEQSVKAQKGERVRENSHTFHPERYDL